MLNPASRYSELVQIYWDSNDNSFWSLTGDPIENIFELVTPSDLYMFRRDPGYSIFTHRSNQRILCEIITDDDVH